MTTRTHTGKTAATIIRVPRTTSAPGGAGDAETEEITAVFTNPDGSEMPVKVTFFQLGHTIGVGVYPAADRGAVLRWDYGPAEIPNVIDWRAPHCPDDKCGSPCSHRRAADTRPAAGPSVRLRPHVATGGG